MRRDKALIISMPFNIGVGGFKRSYFVLPYLSKLLREAFKEVELYIPANAIRTALKYLVYLNREYCQNVNTRECLDSLVKELIESINEIVKASRYNLDVNEKIIAKAIELNTRIIEKDISRLKINKHAITAHLIDRLRPLLTSLLEKKLWESSRRYIAEYYSIIYSQHETADALTTASLAASRAEKVVILLQLDIKGLYVRDLLDKLKGKLAGFLSVSPQPIVESPFITGFSRQFKIITPSYSLDPKVLDFTSRIEHLKPSRERYRAVYFGRLSRDKGLPDLLKAWKLVIKEIPQAKLTLIGPPENTEILLLLERYRRELGKSIRYTGPLHGESLFSEVITNDLLAYPSYRDSFSMTILESLTLGLKVIAYDIPIVRHFYGHSNMVYIVRKGDIKSFAKSVVHAFQEEKEPDSYTRALIMMHSSWERVANAEFKALISVLQK